VADNRLPADFFFILVKVRKTMNRMNKARKTLTAADRKSRSEELGNLYSSRNVTLIVP